MKVLFLAGTVALIASAAAASPAHPTDLFSTTMPVGGSDQAQIVAAVARDEPSVVAINVNLTGQSDPDADLDDTTGESARVSGSGFVYSSEGYIVTNAHVVSAPSGTAVRSIEVSFANGDNVPAHVYSLDQSADVAVIKVDGYAKLPPALPLADSNALRAGQWAIAIGEPLELKQSVTVGVVSAFNRSETIGGEQEGADHQFSGLLQTSAPINPGNSGGPLIDMDGRVIGINQAVAGNAQGIGFAIPINAVKTKVAQLLRQPEGAPGVADLQPSLGDEGDGNDDQSLQPPENGSNQSTSPGPAVDSPEIVGGSDDSSAGA